MPTTIGTRIGPYEVLGWLGAGGMGEVYRARDSRLGREVAIKLVPDASASDPARVHRFEQEARAAGQLNHPNVLAVFDVGLHQGAPYIVSELLEGETLRARLRAGRLPPSTAVDYARQTAQGLAAAHDKGIVHRDVKPDNLFVTSDGRIKIVDFGIAKLTQPCDGSPAAAVQTETAAGLIVGTASYMSPEQVRGELVDTRSDIFSVGIVLHEMLTGRPAFTRETVADTMAAILKEEPREPLPGDVPPALERIVSRCLEKARETRYQSARDLAFGLAVLSDPSMLARSGAAAARRRRVAPVAAALVGLGAAVAAALWLQRDVPVGRADNPLVDAKFSRLTDWPGTEAGAEISADGKFVLFIADRDGQLDLFLSQVESGHFLNLTRDIPPLRIPGPILRTVGFSGDASELYFVQESGAVHMPLTGGTPRPFLRPGAAGPSWSPDENRLVYFDATNSDALYVANRTGGDARPLRVDAPGFFAPTLHTHNPVWSQAGDWIYFAHGPDPTEQMDLYRVRPAGGVPEQLTTLPAAANFLAPIDARTLLYVARHQDGSGPWLWSLDVQTRATQRVTSGLEHYSSISASRDGRRVVATVANPTASLWRVPILARMATDGDVQQVALARARAFAPRLRNDTLFFLSSSGAVDGLWQSRDGAEDEVWRPQGDSLVEPPAVSPDGTRVAVVARQGGKLRLVTMKADGTDAQTLAPSIEMRASGQGNADWSPDGKWIVAAGTGPQGPGLFRISVDGGEPKPLVSGAMSNPVWSPDGRLIVYGGPVVSGQVPLLAVRPDGTPVALRGTAEGGPLLARIGGGHRFLPDGSGLVYLPRVQSLDFWLLDVAAGTTRPLTRLSDAGALNAFDVTADGTHIVFDRSRQNSDIYLIELPGR